jgi:hypothetical protein
MTLPREVLKDGNGSSGAESQSASLTKPAHACDWAKRKFGGSRQSSVEIALVWPILRAH